MACVYVTLGPTTVASAEEPSGTVCICLSASGDKNHQAVACSAQPTNVSTGYVSPGVSPRTRMWEPTSAYTVSVDPTETSKSHNDVAINVPTSGSRSTARSKQEPVHLHFDDRGEPIMNGDPASNVVKAATPASSVYVYLDMLPKPASTSPAAGAHTSTTTCIDRNAGLHSKISEFFGKRDSRRSRAGTLIRHGGKGHHSASLRRGHQAGPGYYDGYLRHGVDRWAHTGLWGQFKHDTAGPRQTVRRGRHRGKGGPHTSDASGGAGCHPMQFPETDPPMRPGGVHQHWGHHVSPACVAVAAPFEASQYRQQLASKVSDAEDDDSARPRDTDTKMRLATFDGEVSSWTGWSFSCLAYFRRSKRETYLLGQVPAPLRQTESQIRRALIGADLALASGDRKYIRSVRASARASGGGGGSSSTGADAAAAPPSAQPDNVGINPEDFDREDVCLPNHTAATAKLLDDDVASVLAREKKQHEAWLYTTTSIFDEIVMSTAGQAAKLVHAVTSRFGHDAWTALNDEYGKLMKGDRTLFTRRLTNGEVTHGQIGMQEGDSVKSFIRDLNSLHSALYWCVPHDERASVPELQYSNMKEVLQNSLSSEYLTVLTAHDGAQNGDATYKDLCLKVITHENLLATRGALRGTSGTGVVAAATDERTDDGTGHHGRGTKRQASGGFDSRDHGKGGGKGYHGGGKGGSGYRGKGKGSGGRSCYGCGSTEHIYRNCPSVSAGDKSHAHWQAQKGKFELAHAQAQANDVTDIKKALAMLITQSAPSPAMAAPSAAPAPGVNPGFMDGWMNVAACETSGPLVFGTQTAPVLTDSTRVVRLSEDGNRGWVTVDFRSGEPRCRAHYHAFRETSADHQGLASGHVCYQGTVAGQRADCNGDAELARSLSELWEQPAYKQRVSKGCSGDAELALSLSIPVEDCSADADIAASLQERPREDCSADTDIATSLQERPRDDCSCDEQLARVLAGVDIASPDSMDTSKLVQGKRTQTARKNYARNERRRQRSAAMHTNEALVKEMEEYHVYLRKHQRQPNKYEQRALRIVARESLQNFEVSHTVVPAADRKCDQHDYSAPFTANNILQTDLLRDVPCMQGCDDNVPIVADCLESTVLALTANNAERAYANVERTVSFDTLAVANKSQRSLYDTDVFIIDTGAGELVSPHEGDFVPGSFVEPYGQRVVAAGSEKHTVVKLGRLRVRCMTTGHTIDSGSQLAWYVPTMTFRLGGMGRLRSIGYGLSIGLGDADFLCHVLSGVKVPVLTYNQVTVLRVEQTGIDSTLATYLTGRFAEESALGKALATSGSDSVAMVVVGESMSPSVSGSTRSLPDADPSEEQESAGDRHSRKHTCVPLKPADVTAPMGPKPTDEAAAVGNGAGTASLSSDPLPQDEDDECGGDDHVYPTEDEHNSYVKSTIADIGDGMIDASDTSDSDNHSDDEDDEYDPLGAIAEAEAEYAAEGPADDTETGPTAAEFMAECPKYVELMQIASQGEKESLASFAHSIETTRGELSMRSEILVSSVDIVLSKTLLEARTRIREQLVDLSGEAETAREMATDASINLGAN